MSWLTIVMIVVGAVAAFPAIILVVRDTIRGEGAWGINAGRVNCPECNAPLPRFRRPKNDRQRMWGGWTCAFCQTEIDKMGQRVEEAG